jgi:hypothetical protein
MSPSGPYRHFAAPNSNVAIGVWPCENEIVNDPGCVKTLRGIIAPGILGSTVMRRAKKRKNLSSARTLRPNQISFSHGQDPSET